jgi:hypothetical protein
VSDIESIKDLCASLSLASIKISMKQKMKAAVVVQFGKTLELQEWDMPTPGPGQILVKTEACGVCHMPHSLASHVVIDFAKG